MDAIADAMARDHPELEALSERMGLGPSAGSWNRALAAWLVTTTAECVCWRGVSLSEGDSGEGQFLMMGFYPPPTGVYLGEERVRFPDPDPFEIDPGVVRPYPIQFSIEDRLRGSTTPEARRMDAVTAMQRALDAIAEAIRLPALSMDVWARYRCWFPGASSSDLARVLDVVRQALEALMRIPIRAWTEVLPGDPLYDTYVARCAVGPAHAIQVRYGARLPTTGRFEEFPLRESEWHILVCSGWATSPYQVAQLIHEAFHFVEGIDHNHDSMLFQNAWAYQGFVCDLLAIPFDRVRVRRRAGASCA